MKKSDTQSSYKTHLLPYAVMVAGMLCALVAATFGSSGVAYADTIPGGNVSDPVVRAVDIAKPAVVRIITTLPSRLTVLFDQGPVTFPQGGGGENGNVYLLTLSGSGTFISSQGDVLTADHVINPPKDQSLLQALNQQAAPDVAKYINQNSKNGTQVTAEQVFQQLNSGQLKSSASYDTAVSEVFYSTDYTGPLSGTSTRDIPADIHATVDKIKKQSAANEKDIAIIHVPFTDTPSVQLGDSSTVQQQDELTIIGFPGTGDVSDRPTDLLTSSVNKITVSSIKQTNSGAPVIQVGGNVGHGDSGGPALNDKGTVVGIVSFGLSTDGSTGGTSFLQASNSARTMVQELNLDTTPGQFQKLWGEAFTTYASNEPGHWHKAQQQFEKLAKQYPQFKAVQRYLDYATQQAKTETVTRPTPSPQGGQTNTPATSTSTDAISIPAVALTAGVVLVLVLLTVALFAVGVRRKKKQAKPARQGGVAAPPVPVQQQQVSPGAVRMPSPPTPPVPAPGDNGLAAFGAPSRTLPPSAPPVRSTPPPATNVSGALRVWPCGHMNRSTARFCNVCGEPAPTQHQPTWRRVEQ
jgi:serine protease Do